MASTTTAYRNSNFRFRVFCGLVCLTGTLAMALIDLFYLCSEHNIMAYPNKLFLLFMMVLLTLEGSTQVIGWIAYQPVEAIEDDDALPTLTAVIPAYNEGRFIRYALSSILRSDYPKHKIRVVAVDDGSSDDTWDHIVAMTPAFDAAGVDFVAHRHKVNMGKRAGIQTGFGLAKGDVIVSLDSDSVLERRTLRNLVAPLVRDPKIGGVAGYLSALNVGPSDSNSTNTNETIVPRLLDVLYDKSGNIPRAAQTQAGNFVTILPGALSAFRTEAVRPLLPGLSTSSFRGRPLRHGEDIELTLGLLQAGWGTTYQSNAVVHTTAPATPRRAFLMFTRWERSSYVYLSMGYLRLAVGGVMKKLSGWYLHDDKATASLPQEEDQVEERDVVDGKVTASQAVAGKNNHLARPPTMGEMVGSLYLLLNLVCTATSNLFLPLACLMQAHTVYTHPTTVPGLFVLVALSSLFPSLLFLADAEVEGLDEETTELRIYQGRPTAAAAAAVSAKGGCCSSCEEAEDSDVDSGYASSSGSERSPVCGCHDGGERRKGEEEEGEEGETITVHSRKDRLAWRFQYGAWASIFHTAYISWTSLYALTTLESQSWLTR